MFVTMISDADVAFGDQTVTVADAKKWADDYGITSPVLVDSDWVMGRTLWPSSYFFDEKRGYAAPQYMITKPGSMEIIRVNLYAKIGDYDPDDYDDDYVRALDEYFIPKIMP